MQPLYLNLQQGNSDRNGKMHTAKPFKRQITVLCIIHKELDTFCNAVRLVPEIPLGSSCRTLWPAL